VNAFGSKLAYHSGAGVASEVVDSNNVMQCRVKAAAVIF